VTATAASTRRVLPLHPGEDDSPVDHAAAAAVFNADEARVDWHDEALWFVRQKRDKAAASLPEWETLRELASSIKEHTLSQLDEYLEQFASRAESNGIHVHWARDAEEHNEIVRGILRANQVKHVVKSKSMLTEECGLNPYLTKRGITVVDTDLGERIVQLRGEPPSHIVLPAIHLTKENVGETFHTELGTPEGMSDPGMLTEAARQHLREHFLHAHAAMTGVNFAIAETGGIVICTNEGNADLGMALAPVYIASMGIEKLVPGVDELAVFIRLLTRSATGQPVTVYTSHVHAPRPGQTMHLILVDNGRSTQLGRDGFWRSLKCIRCGACMNTCPVYRRSGGHSYGATVPGPIGSVLTPGLDLEKYAALSFASTLCGSCTAVCPVKIDLDAQLLRWRERVVQAGYVGVGKRAAFAVATGVLRHRSSMDTAGWFMRLGLRVLNLLPASIAGRFAGVWGRDRALPLAPRESFTSWYHKHHSPTDAVNSRGDS